MLQFWIYQDFLLMCVTWSIQLELHNNFFDKSTIKVVYDISPVIPSFKPPLDIFSKAI